MKKKINHPNLIWLVAVVSLSLNFLVLFSARQILADESTMSQNISNQRNAYLAPTSDPALVSTKVNSDGSNNATKELMPWFDFKFSNGDKIQGRVNISGKVEGALAVEFYLIKKGSINPEYYVGVGKSPDGKQWESTFNSRQFPNGEYEIFAKIKNVYGSYKSDKVSIAIDNSGATAAKTTPTPSPSVAPVTSSMNVNSVGGSSPMSTNTNNKSSNPSSTIATPTPATAPTSSVSSSAGKTSSSETTVAPSAAREMSLVYEQEKTISGNTALSTEEKAVQLEQLQVKKEEIKKEFVSRQEAERIVAKDVSRMTVEEKDKLAKIRQQFKEDTDGDGLPDFEEERIGTDIFSADTDKDGYLDGDEVAKGFNPLKAGSGDGSDRIVFEEPKNVGPTNPVYEVAKVTYEKKKETTEQGIQTEKEGIALQGKALPNSFVTLFIYSSAPIVVTVQADENGSWQYFLDKELEDGSHQVYATVTDNTGKITSKSETFSFVKTARAVETIDGNTSSKDLMQKNASPLERTQVKLAKFILIFSFISFFLAIGSIALFVKHREFFKKKIEEMKNNE